MQNLLGWDIRMMAGVYQIKNLRNSKTYVGSSFRLTKRWSRHQSRLRNQTHENPKLQNAWNKYGADAFAFEILLYCDSKNCLMYEQIALDHYKPEYNVCLIAGNRSGMKHTDESRQKMSKAHRGKKFSKDHRTNLSKSLRGKGANITPQIAHSIKQDIAYGLGNKSIAEKHSVTIKTIEGIKYGGKWAWILEGLEQ